MKKKITAFILTIVLVVTMIPTAAFAADYGMYPKYTGRSGSVVDVLNSMGVDSSFNNRKTIASVNGYSNYRGTESENTALVKLAKQGTMKNPNAKLSSSAAGSATHSVNNGYFPRYTGNSGSVVDVLNSLGVDSSFNNRKHIGNANGFTNYTGKVSENTHLVKLAKQGKLVDPSTQTNLALIGNGKVSYYDTAVKTTLRAEPYEASSVIVSVPKNSTIMVVEKVTNKYKNVWYRACVYCDEGVKEGYIYSGKLSLHEHSYESLAFNGVTYRICPCGNVDVVAKSSAKTAEGQKAVSAASAAVPLALADGFLPVGDLIAAGILIVSVCIAHDYLVPAVEDLASMISQADFDEYLEKRKESTCSPCSFRKVLRFPGGLKYVDNHCMDAVEAYIYVRLFGGDIYTSDENSALMLASMLGSSIMERDKAKPKKDISTYYFHYHVDVVILDAFHTERPNKAHVFFGENDLGQTPV